MSSIKLIISLIAFLAFFHAKTETRREVFEKAVDYANWKLVEAYLEDWISIDEKNSGITSEKLRKYSEKFDFENNVTNAPKSSDIIRFFKQSGWEDTKDLAVRINNLDIFYDDQFSDELLFSLLLGGLSNVNSKHVNVNFNVMNFTSFQETRIVISTEIAKYFIEKKWAISKVSIGNESTNIPSNIFKGLLLDYVIIGTIIFILSFLIRHYLIFRSGRKLKAVVNALKSHENTGVEKLKTDLQSHQRELHSTEKTLEIYNKKVDSFGVLLRDFTKEYFRPNKVFYLPKPRNFKQSDKLQFLERDKTFYKNTKSIFMFLVNDANDKAHVFIVKDRFHQDKDKDELQRRCFEPEISQDIYNKTVIPGIAVKQSAEKWVLDKQMKVM